MKKIVAGLLAFSLIIGGIYFVAPEASEAKAETPEETAEQIVYTTETRTEDANGTVRKSIEEQTVEESTENPGWLFAGWFTDQYCKTPVTTTVEGTTYHAKFVDPGVMNVKLQITKGTTTESETTNMRLITSVDSLDYAEVGFDVYYDTAIGTEEPTKNIPIYTVYERIVASSESGVEYNYSSKVVDTDSEYFATATLIDIAKDNFDKAFHIKPYWITLGGAKVYGTSRYVTIADDALSTTTVNVPVKIAEGDTYTVTEDAGASIAYHDGTYAHFRISTTAASKSLNKYNVSNGTETAVAYHRNLETVYAPSGDVYDETAADSTWYTAYANAEGAVSETEFVIATAADLYALPGLSDDGVTFKNKTVYVVADIVANTGTAGVNGWTVQTGQTQYRWVPVGDAYAFQGTFDGQGHTISGLYTNNAIYYNGFFGNVYEATFKNFTLENSIFKSTNITNNTDTPTASGTIAANGKFTMENVHSSANISNVALHLGGMVGRATQESSLKNCWYSGTVYSRATSGNVRAGGLVGYMLKGTNVIESCAFTGKIDIQGGGARFGGFVGDSNAPTTAYINISDSLSAGTISVKSGVTATDVGSIAGRANGAAITINNVYATSECYSVTAGTDANATVTGTVPQIAKVSLQGLTAYHTTGLDYQDNWSIKEGELPVLRVFAESDYEITEDIKADTSWYTGDATTYEIADAADLYGLAVLVNSGNTFEGITLKLTDNIDLNEGWDGELKIVNGGPVAPEKPVNEWIPIGTSTNMFKGTFEGNGKTIKGLYLDKRTADGNGAGLFGNVYNVDDSTQMCTIQNFGIDNSYIYVNAITNSYTGGIVGQGEALIKNVYCDVDLYGVNSSGIGGIIGSIGGASKADTLCKMDNCWYDGKLVFRVGASGYNNINIGGFVGYILFGVNNTMEHCLFTGEINYKTSSTTGTIQPRLGGFIGRNNSSNGYISISDSLSAGTIVLASASENPIVVQAGSVMGSERGTASGTAAYLPISNVYVSADYTVPAVYGSGTGVLTSFKDSTGAATTIDAVADWSTGIQNLDENYWTMSTTIPVLKSLVDYTGWELARPDGEEYGTFF